MLLGHFLLYNHEEIHLYLLSKSLLIEFVSAQYGQLPHEGGNTVNDHDSHDELQQQHQLMLLQELQKYLMNLERSRQELKASTMTAQQQKQLFWAERFWANLQPELARATRTKTTPMRGFNIWDVKRRRGDVLGGTIAKLLLLSGAHCSDAVL